MAFDINSLSDIAQLNYNRGAWDYWTNDDRTIVTAAGYFDPASKVFAVGDTIMIVAAGVLMPMVVSTSGGATVTVALATSDIAGSFAGTAPIVFQNTINQADNLAIGDGQGFFVVPACMNGMNIVSGLAVVRTAGTTGTTDFQLRRRRTGADIDVLSTKLTIDSAETSSATAAVAMVINTANDDLVTGDILYHDIDAISTTPPQGGGVVYEARLP